MKNISNFRITAAIGLYLTAFSPGLLRLEAAPPDTHQIVPGKSIGLVSRTHRGGAALKPLGKPAYSVQPAG